MSKKISIYDIAKKSGVSAASVSYVINGKKKVSFETKQLVLKTIKELGYVRSNRARGLSTGTNQLIGLYLPIDKAEEAFSQNHFFVELIAGIEKGLEGTDYDLVIGTQKNSKHFNEWVISRGLDAVILVGRLPEEASSDIHCMDTPIVLVDVYSDNSEDFINVRVDDKKGAYLACKYLIENGHTRIGFAGSKTLSLIDKVRYEGYQEAMNESRLEITEEYNYEMYATFLHGKTLAEEYLKRNNVTAILCSGDMLAIGLIKSLAELGKSVPNDLSVVGFDDISDSEFIFPGLTTVHQGIDNKGQLAVEALLKCINKQPLKNKNITFEPTLTIRKSVKSI
mgnify:CR=1 FL=1